MMGYKSGMKDDLEEKNAAWWAAHPRLRESWRDPVATKEGTTQWSIPRGSAASFAFTVLHKMHNAESSRRYNTKDGTGGPLVAADRFDIRFYAVEATKAWLVEAQNEKDMYPPNDPHWRGYMPSDIDSVIRQLQIALDDFEHNGLAP